MAIFTVQVFKEAFGEEWSNRYLVRADTMEQAVFSAPAIATAERSIHKESVLFTYIRVSDEISPGLYATIPVNDIGDIATSDQWLPLFNTARCDIIVNGFGRPSRKFFRLPLLEAEVTAGALVGTLVSEITAVMNGLITDMASAPNLTPLVDPDDQEWEDAITFPGVQMRQLHRRRRRVTP